MPGSEQAVEVLETRFRPIAELGEGGMAKVHLAVARGPSGFNKLVVLKTLRPSLATDATLVDMLMREARLAAQLNHPNVVQTYEVTEDGGLPVIVMEYLEGQPLSQIVARAKSGPRFPLMMQLSTLCDALAGLQHAHELRDFDGAKLNLVHRDVSPDNVFVTYDGQVKLLDFGIAKVATVAPEGTGTGVVKGKVRYMAPEQMEGGEIDRRADLFAVGVLLWEALTNERIWSGLPDVAVMTKVMRGEIPSPRSLRPEVPEALDRICMKAMSPIPENRYETAQEFQVALEGAMADVGTAVRPRDLGQWVASLFADTRARIRTIIEEEINRSAETSSSGIGRTKILAISLPKLGTTPLGITPLSQPAPVSPPASIPFRWVLVGLGAILCLGLAAWAGQTPSSHAKASEVAAQPRPSAAAPSSAEPAAAPATPQTVDIAVTASPSQARLFFDDQPLETNPATLTRPKDGSNHTVSAIAAGFATKSMAVSLDRDSTVALDLERQVAATPNNRSNRSSHPPVAPTNAAAPGASPKPACAVPYYFDERGIKKIRTECL